MASAKEIQNRMKSIQDTQKITNAMYMVSSAKLKKAKKRLDDTAPYYHAIGPAISCILRHLPDLNHVFLDDYEDEKREETPTKRGYLVITADKGLAGAYNHNVLKVAQQEMEKEGEKYLFVVGELGRQFFEGKGIPIDTHFHYTAQDPTINRSRRITTQLVEMYLARELDEVYLIYTDMVNNVQEEVIMEKLLPLSRVEFAPPTPLVDVYLEEFLMYPSPERVLDSIIPNYINGYIYCALVESYSCEQNARMMAMKAANDSASDMLKELGITYNRIRQAAITQEITEIIGGAKALKRKK